MSRKTSIAAAIASILITYAFIGGYQSWEKRDDQKSMFIKAGELSKKLGRGLLVIGNPQESPTNYMLGTYSCGDICIDMNGCECEAGSNARVIVGRLEEELYKISDRSVVIFESETLEYVDRSKIDDVIAQMDRISGGAIFSVHGLRPNELTTTLKMIGYDTFNFVFGKRVIPVSQLFVTYPPNVAGYTYK